MINTIYFESEVRDHPKVQQIFDRFSAAQKIAIARYGEVFNPRNQNFRLQKSNPSLILAKKYDGFVLPVPEGFGIGGRKNFYFSHMYNCIYDCRYCFLQGMYSSANYVLFVNYEDFEREIEKIIRNFNNEEITFFSGYDCDSLALENVTGFVSYILPLFRRYPNALLELRTKSVQTIPLQSEEAMKNCIVAYSILPEAISAYLDNKVPSVKRRLETMKTLADSGWRIGLRFDPLIHGQDWQLLYKHLIEDVFSYIAPSQIHSISFGALRFPKKMFKKLHKLYPDEILFSGPLSTNNGSVSYKRIIEKEMVEFCQNLVKEYVSESIVFDCSFDPKVSEAETLG